MAAKPWPLSKSSPPSGEAEAAFSVEEVKALMADHLLMKREKAVDRVSNHLKANPGADMSDLKSGVLDATGEDRWESKHGAFLCANAIIVHGAPDAAFREAVMERCKARLEDIEARVRLAVTDALQGLASVEGISIYHNVSERILASIENNFERQDEILRKRAEEGLDSGPDSGNDSGGETGEDDDEGWRNRKKTKLKHDTEGWKALETSMKGLQKIMSGIGVPFKSELEENSKILDLVRRAVHHTNRFVRETGYFTYGTICATVSEEHLKSIAHKVVPEIAKGLADNWSQVRFSASVAAREFMMNMKNYRDEFFPSMAPRMCLNRHYVAEGVRVYSQETWRRVMENRGPAVIAKFAKETAEFYVSQTEADNHAVREAACHCIAEMGEKIDKEAVKPHVNTMLQALLICFRDQSWPVRDAACIASGNFVKAFPDESRPTLEEFYSLWFAHISDNIWSVREDVAVALGEVMRAYGQEAIVRVDAEVTKLLPRAKEQPSDSKSFASLSNTTTFGVAQSKRARDNDDKLHTGQPMYSCGSLAPKMKRGCGCMDHGFDRPKEPWESSDGCVYLLREMATIDANLVVKHIPMLIEVAALKDFAHHAYFLETICKQLPNIFKPMGKRMFKPFINEDLLNVLSYALQCENRNAQLASADCLSAIATMIGPNILAGRLNQEQQNAIRKSEFASGRPEFAPIFGGF